MCLSSIILQSSETILTVQIIKGADILPGKRYKMAQLSEKELSSLHDMLSEEDLLVKKFKMLADQATDPEVKNKLTEISNKHQGHFNTLYSQLK